MRRASLVFLIICLAGLWAAPAPARAASAPIATSAALLDDTICDLLTGDSLDGAVRRVVARGARKRWYGTLLADVVLESAKYLCPKAIAYAKRVVVGLFKRGETPGVLSTARTWNRALPDLEAYSVGVSLGVSTSYVDRAVQDLCSDVRANRNAVASVVRWFRNARIAHLRAMNGLVSLASRRCKLIARNISALTSAVLQVVLSNESGADIDPPVAWFTTFRQNPAAGGRVQVSAFFSGQDLGSGVARYVVWIRTDRWYLLSDRATGPSLSTTLPPGTNYYWALQAVDRAGIRGPVAYSTAGRT